MNRQLLFEKKYGTLTYDPDGSYILYKAYSPMTGKQFRDVLNQLLQFYKSKSRFHDKLFIIGDIRLQGKIAPAERIWMEEYWNKEMYKAGLREIAFIVPSSILSKKMESLPKTDNGINPYYLEKTLFLSMKEAVIWAENRKQTVFATSYSQM